MPRKLDDTDPYIPVVKVLTPAKAEALMKAGTWHSSNANSADGEMVEYVGVFKKDIEAQGLPLTLSTQTPFGAARQVTSWGAIRHTENQYEVPLEVLEKAAGKLIDEVNPKQRPKSAGARGKHARALEDTWVPVSDVEPTPPQKPMTKAQALGLMKVGMWSKGNSYVGDKSRSAETLTVFRKDIEALGLPIDLSTQSPLGQTMQVTSWGGIMHTPDQFAVPLKTLEDAAGSPIEAVSPNARPRSAGERRGAIKPDNVSQDRTWTKEA